MPTHAHRPDPVRGADPNLTPIFGRQAEITAVLRLLAQPECRMVTIYGPGGVGKTRLSQEIAARCQAGTRDGAAFIALEPVIAAEGFAAAIADTLGLVLPGSEEPIEQLAPQLHEAEMLLVLDNFEHLLGAVAQLVYLLDRLPGIKFLVTSREVLALQQEYLFRLEGLEVPEHAHVDNLANYSAVQLFSQHARRVQQDFDLASEAEAVVAICQQLEGLPLALELAASWRRSLQSAEIARTLVQDRAFLATRMQDVPERHRSMQVVFAQSWQYLSPVEQDAFSRLAVFRGSFSVEAAQAVAGGDLMLLAALADKSLLRRETSGRCRIHALLHQFAGDQLARSPDLAGEIQLRHCRYYLDFLAARQPALIFVSSETTLAEVRQELDNIQFAWEFAVDHGLAGELHKANKALDAFYQTQSRYREGRRVMARAVLRVAELPPDENNLRLLAELLVAQSWFAIRLGRFEEAERLCLRAWQIYAAGQIPVARIFGGDPRGVMVVLHNLHGEYDQALALGQELLHACAEQEDQINLAFAHYVLSFTHLATGDFNQAREHGKRASELTRQTGDRWFLAYPLIEWGSAERALGNYTAARRLYQECYDLRTEFNDPEGMALALSHLGRVAILEKQYAQAEQLYRESARIYGRINDRGGLANAVNGLGIVACKYDQRERAAEFFSQALETSVEIEFIPLTLNILVCAGELMLAARETTAAAAVLRTVYQHPASEQEVRLYAAELLDLPGDANLAHTNQEAQEAVLHDPAARLEEAVQTVRRSMAAQRAAQDRLRRGGERGPASSTQPADAPPQAGLVEPLTARELEVLALIAAGYTNRGIAETLVLSTGTVKWYASQIYQKLGVRSRTQAVAAAHALNLLPPD